MFLLLQHFDVNSWLCIGSAVDSVDNLVHARNTLCKTVLIDRLADLVISCVVPCIASNRVGCLKWRNIRRILLDILWDSVWFGSPSSENYLWYFGLTINKCGIYSPHFIKISKIHDGFAAQCDIFIDSISYSLLRCSNFMFRDWHTRFSSVSFWKATIFSVVNWSCRLTFVWGPRLRMILSVFFQKHQSSNVIIWEKVKIMLPIWNNCF